jgi:hypothetical protein
MLSLSLPYFNTEEYNDTYMAIEHPCIGISHRIRKEEANSPPLCSPLLSTDRSEDEKSLSLVLGLDSTKGAVSFDPVHKARIP